MIITLPFKTPTVNHLYFNWKGRTIKTKEAKELKKEILELVGGSWNEIQSRQIKDKTLKVVVEVYEDWLCKDGSVKKKDVANREKFIIDSVFDSLGIDDKYIYELIIRKVQSEKEQAIIKIEVYNEI